MNCKMTTNEPKKQTKQTSRTGTESQKWRSCEGLAVGKGRRENGEKGTGNKKYKQQVQNRQGDVRDSMGNGKAEELI